jgi:hypothetical protein
MPQFIQSIRSFTINGLSAVVEGIGFFASFAGSALALFFGKLMLAVVLGAFAVGVFFRLSGRLRGQERRPAPRAPSWAWLAAGFLALVFTALLVEVTALPVRFNQAGFSYLHWVLVCAALALTFHWMVRLLAWMTRGTRKNVGTGIQ